MSGVTPQELDALRALASNGGARTVIATDVLNRLLQQYDAQQSTISDFMAMRPCPICKAVGTCFCPDRYREGAKRLQDFVENIVDEYCDAMGKQAAYDALKYVLPLYMDDEYCNDRCEFMTYNDAAKPVCGITLQPLAVMVNNYGEVWPKRCERCKEVTRARESTEDETRSDCEVGVCLTSS